MSSEFNDEINILYLPVEVLEEILSYVPDQLTLGQVCKSFYEISCKISSYRLEITIGSPTNQMTVNLEDDEIYESILRSDRKIVSLYICSEESYRSQRSLRLNQVIEHIGEYVRYLGTYKKVLSRDEISLLNFMPNLEEVILSDVGLDKFKIPKNFKLRLFRLKKLKIARSSVDILELFDRLPDDVLLKLTLNNIEKSGTTRKFFQNQRKIYDCVTFETIDLDCLDLRQLKLKSLEAYLGNKYREILNGQDELTFLGVEIDQLHRENVDFICNELKSLENLIIHDWGSASTFVDLSKFQKLKNLKKLELTFDENPAIVETAKTLKSTSLQKLNFWGIPEEVYLSLSINCPNLRESEINNEDFNADEFISLFPKLEKLTCNTEEVSFSEGWENKSLKHLNAKSYDEISEETIKFMKCLKNLQVVVLSGISNEMLNLLLIEVPSLKTLCFNHNDEKNYEVIRDHGKNLKCIHVKCVYDREIYLIAKAVLKDLLPVYKMVKCGDSGFDFSMKKHGKAEKCCEDLDEIWTH